MAVTAVDLLLKLQNMKAWIFAVVTTKTKKQNWEHTPNTVYFFIISENQMNIILS